MQIRLNWFLSVLEHHISNKIISQILSIVIIVLNIFFLLKTDSFQSELENIKKVL